MTRLKHLLAGAAAALAFASPAIAQSGHDQHQGMPMPATPAPSPTTTPETPPSNTPQPATTAAPTSGSADPHAGHDVSSMPGMNMPAGHDMSAMPQQRASTTTAQTPEPAAPSSVDPQAGHAMPMQDKPPAPQPVDPQAGHDMSAMPGMEMPAGHDMSAMPEGPTGTDLPAGNAPPPPVPADHAADAVYAPEQMAMGRHHLQEMHGGQRLAQIMLNIAEYQVRRGRDGFEWDGEGWYGGDIDRLWLKSEGEGEFGRPIERAEIQALYSHAIDPYFNLQAGIRYDFKPNPSRVYAVVGFEGLAPSFFDVEGTIFLSNKGELLARVGGYYDQRISQRLILQPRIELNFAAQDSREIGVGSGLSDAEVGLRLRYDIRREFAPYVGVQYQRSFGDTRRFLRSAGEDLGGWSFLAGIRTWF